VIGSPVVACVIGPLEQVELAFEALLAVHCSLNARGETGGETRPHGGDRPGVAGVSLISRPVIPDVLVALEQVRLAGERTLAGDGGVDAGCEVGRKTVPLGGDRLGVARVGFVGRPVVADVAVTLEEVKFASESYLAVERGVDAGCEVGRKAVPLGGDRLGIAGIGQVVAVVVAEVLGPAEEVSLAGERSFAFDGGVEIGPQIALASAIKRPDAADVVVGQGPEGAAIEGVHNGASVVRVVEAKRVASLVERHRVEISAGRGQVAGPRLSVVEVQISGEVAVWRRVESVGQGPAHPIERVAGSVAMVARLEADVDVGAGRDLMIRDFGYQAPTPVGVEERRFHAGVGQVGRALAEVVAGVEVGPLGRPSDKFRRPARGRRPLVGHTATRTAHQGERLGVQSARHWQAVETLEIGHRRLGGVVEVANLGLGQRFVGCHHSLLTREPEPAETSEEGV